MKERERPLGDLTQQIYGRTAELIKLAQTAIPETQATLTRNYRIMFGDNTSVDVYASLDPDGRSVSTVYVMFEPNFTERWVLSGHRGLTLNPALKIDRDCESGKLGASIWFWQKETRIDRVIKAAQELLKYYPPKPDIRLICPTPLDGLADKVQAATKVGREITLESMPYPDKLLGRINDKIAKPPTKFIRLS